MKIIQIKNQHRRIPENWNELNGKQVVAIMKIFNGQCADLNQARLALLRVLAGLSWYQFFTCSVQQLSEYFYLTDFLIQANTLTIQPVKQYRGFYGPADDFSNLRMQEWVYAESYFLAWKQSKEVDQELLNKLVAVLYRKAKKDYNKKINADGDVREDFKENVSAHHAAKEIARWPLAVKQAMATWYEGCRMKLIRDFNECFTGSGDPSQYGMVAVMIGVAESGIFGDFSKVENQYLRLVMVQWHLSIIEANKLKTTANG